MKGHISDPVYNACAIKKIKRRIKDLQEPHLYDECLKISNYNESLGCLERKLQKYNEKLNKLYEPLSTDDMKKAQFSWDRFKEADCDYKASKSACKDKCKRIYSVCLVNRTKERIQELSTSLLSVDWFQDDEPNDHKNKGPSRLCGTMLH